MKRRDFITLLGGAATWPATARAQQTALPVVGFLHNASAGAWAPFITAFRNGLSEVGYVDGQNVTIEYRWAEGRDDRVPALATELIRRPVSVIVTNTIGAQAARAATKTIPIIFLVGTDPVKLGLVASLNRPGGNMTGVNFFNQELEAKRLGLLHELVPKAALVAVLVNPNRPDAMDQLGKVKEAVLGLGLRTHILDANTVIEIESGFASLAQQRADALIVTADPFLLSRRDQIVALAAGHAIPTIYSTHEFTDAGGLMSYGTSQTDGYRQVGVYAGRVLKGEKPADLPVMQSTKFEFLINLKTAKVLGLEVPLSLSASADRVIE
jgi:putative ABC transport system substrate-binding protein